MKSEVQQQSRDARKAARLWTAIFLPPTIWLIEMQTNYSLVPRVCVHGDQWLLHVVSLAALVAAGTGGLLGWREWRRLGSEYPKANGGPEDRARMMGLLGAMSGGIFTLVIAAQWIPNFVFGACDV